MSSTVAAAKAALVAAFLEYADWDNAVSEPHDVTLGTKKEADPFDLIDAPEVTFPVLTVQVANPQPSRKFGLQQELRYTVTVSIIYHYAATEQPDTQLEDLTGKVIWNILRSKDLEGQWIGLDWVADIPTWTPAPTNNYLNEAVRLKGSDQDADGGGFVASQTNFVVVTYEV